MSHGPHINRPEGAIFDDECYECVHKAKDPVIHLDSERIAQLWNLMIRVEVEDSSHYLTESDKLAAQSLWRTYLLLDRHTNIDPKTLLLY